MNVPLGEVTAAGPTTAQVGSAAARVVAAAAPDGASAAQAAALAARLESLAVRDREVLDAARSALDGASPDADDERRDFALGRKLEAAADVPLAIAEACADVASLARELAPLASVAGGGDLQSAALLAEGAARAAAYLVEINLVADDARIARARAAAGLP